MAKEPRILAGETAAITGAARGIGRATAEALLAQGMKVAIGDVDYDQAAKTASELGPSAVALPLDVTERASFSAFLDGAEQQLGPIDVLVNNAGIMQIGRFIDEDDLTARRMIDINLHGVILGMKLALERMIPRNRGHIVNISSQAGKYGAPGGATYSATKHAVVGLTEAVRGELRLMGAPVDLSYVMPFAVKTELGAGLGDARGMHHLEPREVADRIVEALQYGIVEVWVPEVRQPHPGALRHPAPLAVGGVRPRDQGRPRARGGRLRQPPQLRASRLTLRARSRGPAAAAPARGLPGGRIGRAGCGSL